MSELSPKYLIGQPLKITAEEKFRLVLKLLRLHCPAPRPIRLRRKPSTDAQLQKLHFDGYTHLVNSDKPKSNQYFLIVINKNLDWGNQLEMIMHEWAHAMSWDSPYKKLHNKDWADAYRKIYQLLIED